MTLFELVAKLVLDTKDYEKGVEDAKQKSSQFASGLKTALGTVGKVAAGAVAAGATAITAMVKQSTMAYSTYEQLAGGTQLMFGDAYDYVMSKSRDAYKNVQMSQNSYLEQVNGFATGLKTSLGGNEQAAAELADKIITAEADIVAATGNTQESVQNAFNGIMRGNYMMLDNLKIGINPTKAGMQEVIDKVNEWNAAQGNLTNYTIDSLADCEAALVDYVKMVGYSGYAQNEAAGTIQGSLSMTKAAWENLITGLADSEADLDSLVSNVVSSATTLVNNVLPKITNALSSIAKALPKIAPVLGKTIVSLITDVLPELVSAAIALVKGLVTAIIDNIDLLVDAAFEIVNMLATSISENLPDLMVAAVSILEKIATSIIENLPMLLDSALNIIMSLAEGIVAAIPQLIAMLPQLITSIVEFIVSALPEIVHTGAELIIALTHGLIDAREELLPAILEIITALASGLMDLRLEILEVGLDLIITLAEGLMSEESLNRMLESAITIIEALIVGIGKMFQQIMAKGGELVGRFISGISSTWQRLKNIGSSIVEWVRNGVSNAIEGAINWGRDLIDNFISGITQKWQDLKDSVSNIASTVKGFLGFSEPEEGPLSNFHTYAPDMMELFAKGIRDNEGLVKGELEKAFDFQDIIQGGVGEITYSTTGGSSPFGAMTELLNRYLPQLANLKVVMDSGKVVGELRDKMNQSLGEVGRYDKRGLATT